jgi:hypothetical protein
MKAAIAKMRRLAEASAPQPAVCPLPEFA